MSRSRNIETPVYIQYEDHGGPPINFDDILVNGIPSLHQLYEMRIQNSIVLFGNEEDGFRVMFTPEGPVLVDSLLQPCDEQDQVTELISEYLTDYYQNRNEETSDIEEESEETPSTEDYKTNSNSKTMPPSPSKHSLNKSSDLEAESCPICLEPWTSGGDHRLVSLKCGHLFGELCVSKWLHTQTLKDRCCPTCKTKASKRDIRSIYARRLVAADTTEIDQLHKKLEMVEAQKNRIEMELQKTKAAHKSTLMRLEELRTRIRQPPTSQPMNWKFGLEKNLEINREGGCRVAIYNTRTYELFVSNKSSNTLFPGFGIRKVHCIDLKLGTFTLLHPKPIRDLAYSAAEDMILSASLDGSARLIQRGVPSFSVKTPTPLWSCAWDIADPRKLLVGAVGGVVSYYDIRKADEPIFQLSASPNGSPIVSLASVPGGFFSCSLTTTMFWSTDPSNCNGFLPETLPIDGPFLNLNYDSELKRLLLYCRPGPSERSRFYVYEPFDIDDKIKYDVEKVFIGSNKSSLMCRANFFRAGADAYVAAYSESDTALQVFPMSLNNPQNIFSSEPALDVVAAYTPQSSLLAALSETRLKIYKPILVN